jgi:2-amino-4-hydroxy-6-hydroxymethyldihydropteridine diphosphokinase
MTAPRQAFVGAGANLGDRAATLAGALARLQSWPGITYVESSSVRETAPVGVVDQPNFLNAVVGLETTLSPEALLAALQEIERAFGRVRTRRWGPRTLDLDLLAYEHERRHTPELELPHPRIWEREFVMTPLRELLGRPRFSSPRWPDLRTRLGLPGSAAGAPHAR